MKKKKVTKKKVGFPGTFDPIHLGQLDVILEAMNPKYNFEVVLIPLQIFNESAKQSTMFSLEERINMLKEVIKSKKLEEKVSIKTLPTERGNLKSSIRQFLKNEGISMIIRGKREDNHDEELRTKEKLEKEFGIRVLFMKTSEHKNISSTLIKEMMEENKDIKKLVPPEIIKMIFRK